MPARAPLIIKDRATPTPADHTFAPQGETQAGVHVFIEKTGPAIGDREITISLNRTATSVRPTLKFQVPVVQTETVNGIDNPVMVRRAIAHLSFNFDSRTSPQEKADLVGFVANTLASSQTMVNDLIVNGNDIY